MMRSGPNSSARGAWNVGLFALSTAIGVAAGISAVARACPDYDPIVEWSLALEAVEAEAGGAAPEDERSRWQDAATLWTADGAGRIELRNARADAPGEAIFFIAEEL